MDVLDSRDLNERLESMEVEVEYMVSLKEEILNTTEAEVSMELQEEYNDLMEDFDKEEYNELLEMKSDISEWDSGVTLINEVDFTEYAIEMLQDIGDLPQDIPWYIVIDEDATAQNLKVDYSCISYKGNEYLFLNI